MTADQPRTPADDEYAELARKLAETQREAGAFLATSLRSDCDRPDTPRRIAEEFARDAIELQDRMKAWRLANGWDR